MTLKKEKTKPSPSHYYTMQANCLYTYRENAEVSLGCHLVLPCPVIKVSGKLQPT